MYMRALYDVSESPGFQLDPDFWVDLTACVNYVSTYCGGPIVCMAYVCRMYCV